MNCQTLWYAQGFGMYCQAFTCCCLPMGIIIKTVRYRACHPLGGGIGADTTQLETLFPELKHSAKRSRSYKAASSVCLTSPTKAQHSFSSGIDIQCLQVIVIHIQEDTKGKKYSYIYTMHHRHSFAATNRRLAHQNWRCKTSRTGAFDTMSEDRTS